jgi:putative CocE/NonD family hydrolase
MREVTVGHAARVFLLLMSVSAVAHTAVLGAPSGTGPFPAVAETRAQLPGHTIFRPEKLPAVPLPLFVWGNGACRDNGLQHASFLRQIASQGYIVVALGHARSEARVEAAAAPAPPVPANPQDETSPAQIIEAIDWAERQNSLAGGELRGHIDVAQVAVGGHSCGGLQALAVSTDPRVRTTLVLNSGIYINRTGRRSGVAIDKTQLDRLHSPLLYLTGGPADIAHLNAADDFARIQRLPVFLGSLPVGHDGTFWREPDGGAWARVAARWLDWRLKGDADASWDFAGPACRLCADKRWTVTAKNLGLPTGPFRQSLYVPVRDGTRLAMNIYRAARGGVPIAEPQPVVFSFTPYRARYRDSRTGKTVEFGQFPQGGHLGLLDQGYVLAVADIRGKGASFGARRGFSDRTEAQDGHDLVQWLAAQPWSSGRIGMYGCSYLGGTTVHVASTQPPALRAIFTGATDLDKFAFVRSGGITAQFNTRPDEPLSDDLMSVPLDEDADGSLMRTAVAEHARNTPMAALWYGMPFRDSVSAFTGTRFWEESSPYTYFDALKTSGIATYYWSNWEDEPTAQVILAARNLGSRLLIGPGSHCVTPPEFDFAGEVRRYFDDHLKQERTEAAAHVPRVTAWLEGASPGEHWQRGDLLPGEGIARQAWHLARGGDDPDAGRLLLRGAGRGKASFKVDYELPSPDGFALWIDSQHGRGASFITDAFTASQDLIGFPILHLTMSSDAAEPLLFAYLEQLSPDGVAKVVAFGRLAAAYRKESRAPYDVLDLPWHAGLAADHAPLKADRPVTLRFALTPTARRIPAGHRLRLVVTGADPRQRNLQQVRIDPPPGITISFGRGADSRLELPLRPVVEK